MTETHDAFDDDARSLTQRLLRASEHAPTRPFETRDASVPRAAAVVFATVVLVAGLIFVGASVLHIQFPRQPTVTPTPPPVVSLGPSPSPTLSSTPAPTATPAPSPTANPAKSISNLRMFTPTAGWAQRQSDGAILHTTNGVARWTLASPRFGTGSVIAAAFVDAQAARVLTATIPAENDSPQTTIHAWATNNGGATWTEVGSFAAFALEYLPDGSLDFVDREHGWFSVTGLDAAGSSALYVYRTVDGGARWTAVVQTEFMSSTAPNSIPLGCDKNQASFINASTGWVTAQCNGGSSFFYATHDGGVTWRSQSLGVGATDEGYTTQPPQFVSATDGFMLGYVGDVPGPAASVFVTVDGGTTWTRRLLPGTSASGWEFLDPNNGWVLLPRPYTVAAPAAADLWVTHDAGRTWTHLETNINVGGLDLDFLTNQIGWAVTALPAPSPPAIGFLQTTDGGRTWTVVTAVIAG